MLLSFILMKAAPGDTVDVIAGESGGATVEYMQELRQLYGLDVPAHEQFWNFLVRLVHLDLGYSFRDNMPVVDLIWSALPATLLLSLSAITFALVVGVALGVIAARHRGSWLAVYRFPVAVVGLCP